MILKLTASILVEVYRFFLVKTIRSFFINNQENQCTSLCYYISMVTIPVEKKKYKLNELLAKVTKENIYPETYFGKPVGKEIFCFN